MYLDHFGLNKAPFQLTPDAGFLYMSPQHAKAKAHMNYAVLNQDSCVVVTGEIGCGKTTLINQFLRDIGDDVRIARIFQTQISTRQFLQTLLAQFGIEAYRKNKAELLSLVTDFLLEQDRRGVQVVLIVDEAQNLSLRVLEEIRLLTDIETEHSKTINVILCGQPELNKLLNDAAMAQLLQRIHFRVHVEPLSMIEMSEYIDHRLRIAGYAGNVPLFPAAIMPTFYRYTGGVPRLINTLCDTVLTAAYVEERLAIDSELVDAAVAELDWGPYASRTRTTDKRTFPSGRVTPPKLVLLRDGEIVSRYVVEERRALIGRDPDNDVPVASEFISRHHAQISFYRGAYWIMDLKSTNGTFVNGKRIRRARLTDRDVIAIGQHRVVFQDAGGGKAQRDTTANLSDFQGTAVLDPSYGINQEADDDAQVERANAKN